MSELIFLVEESMEGGYIAEALGHSIYTDGDSIEELKKNIMDALKCHFDNSELAPKIIRLHYVRDEILSYA